MIDEIFKPWKPVIDGCPLEHRLEVLQLVSNYKGLSIIMGSGIHKISVEIFFDFDVVCGYNTFNESERLMLLGKLPVRKYRDCTQFFIGERTSYCNWVEQESYDIRKAPEFTHLIILSEEIVEVLFMKGELPSVSYIPHNDDFFYP